VLSGDQLGEKAAELARLLTWYQMDRQRKEASPTPSDLAVRVFLKMKNNITLYSLHRSPQAFLDGDGYVESASCEWAGQHFEARSRSSAVMELARRLVAAGAPDGAWRSLTRDGLPSTSGPSLHRLSRLTVKEKDRGTITFARYQERPNFVSGDGKDGFSESAPYSDTLAAADRPENVDCDRTAGLSPPRLAEAA
jgi:hypothetical protein